MGREVLKVHAAERIARAIAGSIDEQGRKDHGHWFAENDQARLDSISKWTALAAQVLDVVFPGQSEDLDEALKLLRSVEGDWAALNDRMRRVWQEEKSEVALPALGPSKDKTVPCDCEGKWESCPWCGGCGWLVPQMKKLLLDATSVKPRSPQEDLSSSLSRVEQQRLLDAWPFVDRMRGIGAIRVEVTPRGGVRVDFPPARPLVDEEDKEHG
jgi:hypothetical protein